MYNVTIFRKVSRLLCFEFVRDVLRVLPRVFDESGANRWSDAMLSDRKDISYLV